MMPLAIITRPQEKICNRALYTIVESAKLSGLDPQAYLPHVLGCIADLLPWNITIPEQEIGAGNPFTLQSPDDAYRQKLHRLGATPSPPGLTLICYRRAVGGDPR
jgi:hypothetical protein